MRGLSYGTDGRMGGMPEPEEMPADPIGELAAAASQLHELYGAYLEAGFTDAQALYLTGQVATGGKGTPPG